MQIFDQIESNVRYYCNLYPEIFSRAKNSIMYTEAGAEYIDFLAGAGSLNYGHNNEYIKRDIIEHLQNDGIIQGLDMYTDTKKNFLKIFHDQILEPRQLNYKVQFCGPTGTNAVEAALKLARSYKNNSEIFAFMGSFHGMTLGSLSVTSSSYHRKASGLDLPKVTFIPFPVGCKARINSIQYMNDILKDSHSGILKPAAIIVETIQAEGGVNIAPVSWLQELETFCHRHDILLICDDIQMGCYRTGSFFSFERAGIIPDIVILSKSISGYGLPMSLLLIKPELDIWKPAEHNGTFRGNQLAFVGARAAIEYSVANKIEEKIQQDALAIENFIVEEILPLHHNISYHGMGFIWAVNMEKLASLVTTREVIDRCFKAGLIIEACGRHDHLIKIMPALTIEREVLLKGLNILKDVLHSSLETDNHIMDSNTSLINQ